MGKDPSKIPEIEHFPPAEALKTIRALLDYLAKHPKSFANADKVSDDLKVLEKDLVLAERHKVPILLAMAD
jgi:hypothetical protein